MQSTRLERSATNRVISGVCGGLAEYLAVDATLVRIFFVLAGIFTGGLFVLAYIAMVFLVPLPGRPANGIASSAGATASEVAETLRRAADEVGHSFRGAPPDAASSHGTTSTEPVVGDPEVRARETERRRTAFGYLLILLGVVFFLGNAGLFHAIQWQLVWPLVIVGIGVFLLVQRVRS